jgi:hypothetical protein
LHETAVPGDVTGDDRRKAAGRRAARRNIIPAGIDVANLIAHVQLHALDTDYELTASKQGALKSSSARSSTRGNVINLTAQ